MTEPIISLIVPIYNGEKFLDKCIQSIESQTLKNIEILLINDGSTDNSGSMCNEYSKKDSRIRVIHKENEGLAETRNIGIKEASANFIFFLDCDDWIEPNALEKLLTTLNKENADIALGCFILNYEDKIVYDTKNKKYNVLNRNEALNLILLDDRITSHMCGNLYKKSLFEGIKFPKNRAYEDYATSYLIFQNANRIVETDYALYHYLQQSDSIIHNPNPMNEYHFFIAELERSHFVHSNPEIFKNPKLYHSHAVKTVLRLLKRILLLTEKGEMEKEIQEMQEFLKTLSDVKCSDVGIDRYIKMKLAINYKNFYQKFLKATKRKNKIYKTNS